MSQTKLSGIEVCIFDAYGTLFDVSSVARGAQDALGDGWQALSDLWRSKQLHTPGYAAWPGIMPTSGKSPATRWISR